MSVKVYGPQRYKDYLASQCKSIGKRDDIEMVCVPNGTVCRDGKPRAHGVYDSAGNWVPASNIIIRNGEKLRRSRRRIAAQYVDADVLFLGNLHRHFGHVLLERLTRVWPVAAGMVRGMKCAVLYSSSADPLPGYYLDMLGALGISRDDIIIVRRPTRFRNVFVPNISKGPDFYSDRFAETFDVIAANVPDATKYDKIYVSRTALDVRRTFGEEKIQAVFERNGFHVIHPERMSITDQIALVKNCRVLAGCAGTALHLALFMQPGGTVVQIKRNSKNEDNAAEQYLINEAKQLDSVFVWASAECWATPHFTNAPQIISAGCYLREFWTDNRFKYSPADLVSDDAEADAYYAAWREYRRAHGPVNKIKRAIIKVTACIIPGRVMRGWFRAWMKKFLGVNEV